MVCLRRPRADYKLYLDQFYLLCSGYGFNCPSYRSLGGDHVAGGGQGGGEEQGMSIEGALNINKQVPRLFHLYYVYRHCGH